MKVRASIRQLLLAAVATFALSGVADADPLVITTTLGQLDTFNFRNAHLTATATDFHITLLTEGARPIKDANGGLSFPKTTLTNADASGNFRGAVLDIGDAGTGVAPGGIFQYNFIGWPAGTKFEVTFSYRIDGKEVFQDPVVFVPEPGQPISLAGQGEISAVPEPATLLLLGTGLSGVAAAVRRRGKGGKGRRT